MPTIGSTNLQDTPSAGPLTEADLDRSPRVPRQRAPILDDDALSCAAGIVRALIWCLALYGVWILALLARRP